MELTIEEFAEAYPGYFPFPVYKALGKVPFDAAGRASLGGRWCRIRGPQNGPNGSRNKRVFLWPPNIYSEKFTGKTFADGVYALLEIYAGSVVFDIEEPPTPETPPPSGIAPALRIGGEGPYSESWETARWQVPIVAVPDRLPSTRYIDEAIAAGRDAYASAPISRFWIMSDPDGYYAARPSPDILYTTAHVDCARMGDGVWREDYRRSNFGQKVDDE